MNWFDIKPSPGTNFPRQGTLTENKMAILYRGAVFYCRSIPYYYGLKYSRNEALLKETVQDLFVLYMAKTCHPGNRSQY